MKELEAAPAGMVRDGKLLDARSRLAAHQEELRVAREAHQAELNGIVGTTLAIAGTTAVGIICCSDREQQRFKTARHRYFSTICDSADPHPRLRTPSTHLTRRGLELHVNGGVVGYEVWRLTLEAWREGRGDLLLTNVSSDKKLRLDSRETSVRFLRRRRNAWELAEGMNALLSNGFRVSPRAVQRALQVLVSGGGDRPADIIAWKIRPRDMIKCVGPDHGRGCVPSCPGVLTHLECRRGGVGEFGDCEQDGSFCEKCGINIRPEERTWRCRACDCDVCEQCVERALEGFIPHGGVVERGPSSSSAFDLFG